MRTKSGSPLNKAAPILITVFLATALAAAGYALATGPSASSQGEGFSFASSLHQGVTGKIVIANISPVCFMGKSESTLGPSLVISYADGRVLTEHPSWTLVNGCELVAEFVVLLPAGAYSITVSPCDYAGCLGLPTHFTVSPGMFTPVRIDIVTGIY